MKDYELIKEELEKIVDYAWEWESARDFLQYEAVAHAAQKKMLEYLAEPCNKHFAAKALKVKTGLCLRRHCCPECMVELLKDFGL